jgi:uncharacterized membrane protein
MIEAWLAGPSGSALVIAALALVTYACRASGVVLMSRLRVTPRVERALRALPGSIVVAVALPTALAAGTPGVLAIVAAGATMMLTHFELAAIAAGVGAAALARAMGW